mgnify:CR=1 FL=1
MSAFNTSMFQSIKDALASSDNKGSATFNEIMQTKSGNTYTVRLLPFAKDPSKTFFFLDKGVTNEILVNNGSIIELDLSP